MLTTDVVISYRLAELKGQNVILSILRIHVQKRDYWLEIKIHTGEAENLICYP
jgi:hypothetical protein